MKNAGQIAAGCLLVCLVACGGCLGMMVFVDRQIAPIANTPPPSIPAPVAPVAPPAVTPPPPTSPAELPSAAPAETKAKSDDDGPFRWVDVISDLEADVERRRGDLTAGERSLVIAKALEAAGQEVPSLFQANPPEVGAVGTVKNCRFIAIAGKDAAQFMVGDYSVFVTGIDTDGLVPGREGYSYEGLYEVVRYLDYKTVLGATQRGPVAQPIRSTRVDALAEQDQRAKSLRAKLHTWHMPDGGQVPALYQSHAGHAITIEEFTGQPITVELCDLSAEDVQFVRLQEPGRKIVIIAREDRSLVEAGHKWRPREWQTSDGKNTVQASFVSASQGKAKLKRADSGKEITIPLERLRSEDREYIQKQGWKGTELAR